MATVLITGANRGIGLALAQRCVARGDQVIATCRTSSAALAALGDGVRIEADVDVTSDASVAGLAERLGARAIDVLVLNAGILREDHLETVDLDDVVAQLAVNAVGPLRVLRALRLHLRPGGKVAVITSRMASMGDNGSGGSYGYRMSKAAVNALGVSAARDLRPAGISVAILHPGFVRTDMTDGAGNLTPDESARLLLERIDQVTLETSGTFWHASGQVLPF
jgi:NAD(P)-dependent dehydrogenase (short-subunit alcohol dehydrogenase family)